MCQNYRTISLISHLSKVMLKIILNRLQPQAEMITAEEQAGFRAGRSTTEQIFSLRILGEKYLQNLQNQQNLYHFFTDFKKAFDRVWHEALWATMRKYNINASIIRAIENQYDKAQGAVLFNGSTGEWFRTTVGVRQWCLLSPILFNIFLERIMCEALDDHEGRVSIGGRLIINFRFADDRRGRRSWRPGIPSRYNHHKVQNGDRPRQDKSDDKQPKWLPKRDQDKRSEARRSGKLQVPWSNHLQTKDQKPRFFPG